MSKDRTTRFQNNLRVDRNLDLSNSTGNLTLSSLSSAPSSPVVGDMYYDTTLQKTRAYQDGGWTAVDGTAAGSLDAAYNGGASITVDAGAVTLADAETDTQGSLLITKSGAVTGSDSASVFHINSTGAHDTSGDVKFLEISVGSETISGAPIGIEIEMNANGDDAILLTRGAMTITDGALTLSSGNFDVTGTGTFSGAVATGALTVTGATTISTTLVVTGNTTAGGTLTVDTDSAVAFVVQEEDATAILTIDTTSGTGDTSMLLTSPVTTGTGLHIDGSTITSGDALKITVISGTMTSTGAALSVVDNVTEIFAIRDDGAIFSLAGTAEGTTAVGITTGDLLLSDGDLTLSGGELAVTDGVTTSGAGITLTSSVTTAIGFDLSVAALTTGKAIDISNLDAITSGKAIHVDATGITQTSGILVHIDSASTALTTSGRLLLVDANGDFDDTGGAVVEIQSAHSTGVGLLMTMDAVTDGFGFDMTADALTSGAGMRLVSSSTGLTTAGNVLYVQASGDFNDSGAAVVEIESAHTVGVGLLMTMDAVTTGFGFDMTADGLTSGVGARFITSSTGLTGGGSVVYMQASADFNDTGAAVLEIESAHTTGVGLLMLMDAATDGFGIDITADALTTGAAMRLISSSTALTGAGNVLYVQASGDFDDTAAVMEIESAHTTGTGLLMTMDAVTDGTGIFMTADALTSGQAVSIASSATAITGNGRMLLVDHTGTTGTTATLSEFLSAATDETDILQVTASGALTGIAFSVTASSMTAGTGIKIDTIQTSGSALHIDNASGVQTDNTGMVFLDHGGNMAAGSNIIRIAPTGTPIEDSVGIEIVGGGRVMQGLVIDSDAATSSANIFSGDGARGANTGIVEILGNSSSGSNSDSSLLRVVQDHTGGVSYCIDLQQDDISQAFINFEGATNAGETSPISTHGTGTITDFVRCSINGATAWIGVVTGSLSA